MLVQKISDQLFKRLDSMESGHLKIITPDGKIREFQGREKGEKATVEFHDWSVLSNMMRKGDIGFAEDYRAGKWETDNLVGLTTLGLRNRRSMEQLVAGNNMSRILAALSYLFKMNSVKGSKRNIHAHYDLGNDFYDLWLDPSMTYSSAIFKNASDDLTTAQHNKYDRIVDCLDKKSGSILEVGCGWGGFAERANHQGDFGIKGITLSEEQHDYARNRLGNSADIVLEDYPQISSRW